MNATREPPPIFVRWFELSAQLFERVGRFPKSLRPTLGHRLLEHALDVLDRLVDLRYARDRVRLFDEASRSLDRLRVLLRLAFETRLVSERQYERFAEEIDVCGRMLGGWRRSTSRGKGDAP